MDTYIYFRKEDSFSEYNRHVCTLYGQKLKAAGYETILDNSAFSTLWQQFKEEPFQHDNVPVYKAASVQDWLDDMEVEELGWPALSPNLNPITHLWDELEHRLRVRPQHPRSVPDLLKILQEDWKSISVPTFQNLLDSLPRITAEMIAAKDRPISYK